MKALSKQRFCNRSSVPIEVAILRIHEPPVRLDLARLTSDILEPQVLQSKAFFFSAAVYPQPMLISPKRKGKKKDSSNAEGSHDAGISFERRYVSVSHLRR